MRNVVINRDGKEEKKRGRKSKKKEGEERKEEQKNKFFVDLGDDQEVLLLVIRLLSEANNKAYGREINFRDLVIHAIPKLNSKDIEKIQDQSLNEMERVKRLLDEHNEKNKTSLSLGEFLVKKLSI
ncbi:MAG: hypothetical protein Q7U04_15425 [Bacteriovorax sp.]|nr:hypothetical protein [Bacteriovorax sp.]